MVMVNGEGITEQQQQQKSIITPPILAANCYRQIRSRTGSLILLLLIIMAVVAAYCFVVASPNFSSTAILLRIFPNLSSSSSPQARLQTDDEVDEAELQRVLKAAAINKTVIVTTLNGAWAKEGALAEMFLGAMKNAGEQLLQQLVVGCMDQLAYNRCATLSSHPNFTILDHSMAQGDLENASISSYLNNASIFPIKDHHDCSNCSQASILSTSSFHCLRIPTTNVDFSGEQLYLTVDYIKMMWRRIRFLGSLLQHGYNFIFTDADILWFRDPFPALHQNDAFDVQIASDYYNGIPSDLHNFPNAGFAYVKANKRTIKFYNYWYEERKRDARMADQEVLNAIKFEEKFKNIGLKLRFLDTQFFGGFCSIRNTDMTKVITMHATCCKGLNAKINDLQMMWDDWKKWQTSQRMKKNATSLPYMDHIVSNISNVNPHFKMPWACPRSWH